MIWLSFTGYRTFRDCPEQYYHKYIMRRKPDTEDQKNFVKGNALHHLLEKYLEQKEQRPDWFRIKAAAQWDEELAAINKNPRHTLQWTATEAKKQKATYLEWASNLADIFAKFGFDPNKMVSEFVADTFTELNGIKFKMVGRIDVMADTNNGGLCVLDLKASANKSIKDYDQVVFYSQLAEMKLGKKVDYVGYILPAFGEVTLHYVPQEARDALMKRVGDAVVSITDAKQSGTDLIPGKPKARPCFWCDLKPHCSIYGGAMEQMAGTVQLGKHDEVGVDDLL